MEPSNLNRQSALYPSLKQSFGLMGIFFLIQIAFSVIFLFLDLSVFNYSYDSATFLFVVYLLTFWLTIWFGLHKRKPWTDTRKFYFETIPFIAYPVIFILTLAVLILLDPLVSLIPMPEILEKALQDFMSDRSPLTIILMVIGAPILEEMLFRGIILDGLLHHYSPRKAILWSSILFGLAHLNPWQFVAAFFGGLLIGWIYWQTRSLLPAMFIHFVMNSTSFLLQFILTGEEPMFLTVESVGEIRNLVLLMVISAAVAGIGILLLKKILFPIRRVDEFKLTGQQKELNRDINIQGETEGNKKALKRKSCLRILFIGAGLLLLLAMVCTLGVKMLLNDSLAQDVKQEIMKLAETDEQLQDRFQIGNISGNRFYIKLELEFLEKPQSIDEVKHWTRYVYRKCIDILQKYDISAQSINIAGIEQLPGGEKSVIGMMSYNGFTGTSTFIKVNGLR